MSDYNYSNYNSGGEWESLHILDFILLIISVCLIFIPVWIGVSSQNIRNQITQKERDMNQVILALNNFFKASSNIPSERKYPISVCSGQPNEVDYEWTLNRHLTGKEVNVEPFAHITPNDFPLDIWGEYSMTTNNRPIKLRSCDGVLGSPNANNLVYSTGAKSCNFAKINANTKFRNCYLYSTDNRGFRYQLAYYNEEIDKYILFTKNREAKMVRSIVDR